MKHARQFHVWYRSNGEIVGVGAVMEAAPERLRVASASDATEQLYVLQIDRHRRDVAVGRGAFSLS
jgi:hypothetical protein